MKPSEITRAQVVNRKPPKRAVRPAAVFGPIGRADRPLRVAQVQSHRAVKRAQAPILQRTNVPYVPKLAHPTPSQHHAAIQIVTRGLKRQGAGPDVQALARGQGSRTQQVQINRYLGGARAERRQAEARTGALSVPRVKPTLGPPAPQAPFSLVDALRPSAVPTLRYLPTGRDELAKIGRQVFASHVAQGKPYAHRRAGIGPATIDLTATAQALSPAVARATAIPLALLKGSAGIVEHERLFSDKSVLGRSANDLLTFPAAAIPTAYQAVTDPGSLASGIAQQVTHPIALTKEHPLFGAMLLHGGVSALGRTSGAVARSGILGQTLKGAAGTQRNMVGLAGESGARLRTPRSYSKDIFRKGAQVLYDKRLRPIRDAKGNVVKDARGRPVMAAPQGVLHPFSSPERLAKQRTTFMTSRANARERYARTQASRLVHAAQPVRERRGVKLGTIPSRAPIPHALRGVTVDTAMVGRAVDRSLASQPATKLRVLSRRLYRPEKDVVAMAMEGTLRSPETFHADLLKEHQRLEDAYQAAKDGTAEMDPLQKRTNRIRARTIDRVIDDKRALANAEGVFASARALAAHGNELSRRLVEAKLLDPAAARRAKLFPYAQSHMGAQVVQHNDGTQTIRAADGTFLSNEQIHAHMRSADTGPVMDPAHIAYLPHRNDVRGARAYHQQFRLGRPNLDQESRTGSAYAAGATDSSFSLPLENIVHATTTLTRTHEFDKLIHDVGIKHPEGRYFTWKEAKNYAKFGGRAPNEATNRRLPGEPKLVPVRALPAKYSEDRAAAIQSEQDPGLPGASERLVREQTSRFDGPDPADPGAKNVVLIPEAVATRMQENLKASHSFDKTFQGVTSAFRTTVLPFSTKWLTGNVVEAILRSGVAGVSPHDPLVGRKVVREMLAQDPEHAAQVLSHLLPGLLYAEKGLTNYRTGQEVAGQLGGMVAHSLPGRAVGKGIKAAASPAFAFNKGLEQTALYGALGKYARQQMQEMTGSWFKAMRAQDQALKDFAKGLQDTAAQHAAAKYLDETLGQYSRFNPTMRRIIQGYAPFLPWYLNSVRFVMHTLPFKHPVKTAVLTQAEAAFQKDWEAQHPGKAGKGSLKTAIPYKGGFVDAARYTPLGFLGPVFAGETSMIPSPLLPQVSGAVHAFEGQDPFGQALKVPKTPTNPQGVSTGGQNTAVALNQLLEGFVPLLGLGRRIREKGGKSYGTSTIFSPQVQPRGPGQPKVSAANRILNPFRPVYVSPGRAGTPTSPSTLSPTQQAILKAHRRTQGSSGSGGLTPAQEAVLRAYRRSHG